MIFAQLPIGARYVLAGDVGRSVYKKLNVEMSICDDGVVFRASDGSHGTAEVEKLSLLDVLAFEMKQAEEGR